MTKVDLLSNFELVEDSSQMGFCKFREAETKLIFGAFFNSKGNVHCITYEQWVKMGNTLVNYIEKKDYVKNIDEIKKYLKNNLDISK